MGNRPVNGVPSKGLAWPMFVISAAVGFNTPRGLEIRTVHAVRVGAAPEAVREWFLQGLSQTSTGGTVIDLDVTELPRETLSEMLRIASATEVGQTRPI